MSKAMKIAIVDDEKDMRQSISQWLALSGFDTEAYASAEEALKSLGPDFPGIAYTTFCSWRHSSVKPAMVFAEVEVLRPTAPEPSFARRRSAKRTFCSLEPRKPESATR